MARTLQTFVASLIVCAALSSELFNTGPEIVNKFSIAEGILVEILSRFFSMYSGGNGITTFAFL